MSQLPKLTVEVSSVRAERAVIETTPYSAENRTYRTGAITYTAELVRGGLVEITAAEFKRLHSELLADAT